MVLAFIVLLTVIVMAFFSNAMLQRQVADSSANQVRADLFALGAVDTIIGDLKQEIAAGSTSTNIATGPVTTTLYYPSAASNAVPALAGSTGTNGLENLVKRSAAGVPFYPGGVGRAATNASTTNASQNARYYTTARWNKHLLLPKANTTSTTDFTPTNTFAAPDWILVARDGSNPTTWNNDIRWSQSNAATVVGRYAYAIYNEGGLLDANVAGYPATVPTTNTAYKSASAYADLTQIGMGQADVDSLVNWRNAASYDNSSTNYVNYVANNRVGFLKTANTNMLSGGGTDRQFADRQQLIEFFNTKLGATNNAPLQNALQYLGSFSRDLDQPSFAPDSNRPKIPSGITGNYKGGNNQFQLDAVANPAFAALRVSASFTRHDGSSSQPGEPLVKKRFALNRLAWITCKGPSASRASSNDADITALKNAGITDDWLKQGTDANILKYFGLSWDNANKRWSYGHGDPTNGICCLPELITGTVDPKRGSGTIAGAPREPDFFELIKAAINVGSLGKASLSQSPVTNGYQALRDTNVNEQIIQIGANILDQFDADGYPTRIWYAGATGGGHEFRGVEDLPYIYRVRTHVIQIALPDPNVNPASTATVTAPYNSADNTVQSGASWIPFKSTGTAASILLPEIWNPHDGSRPLPSMMPSEFHVTADTTDPDSQFSYCKVNAFSITAITLNGNATTTRSDTVGGSTAVRTSSPYNPALFLPPGNQVPLYGSGPNQNNDIQFNVSDTRQFREPTALFIPGKPAGSNLRYGPRDWVVGGSSFGTTTPSLPLNADGTAMVESVSGNSYLGICVGVAPLAWITTISGNDTYVKMAGTSPHSGITSGGITYHLWYMDPFGTLRVYDEKYSGYTGVGGAYVPGQHGFGWPSSTTVGVVGSPRLDGAGGCLMVFADPRTRRWGAGMINVSLSGPVIPQPATQPYPIPSPVCMPWRQNESSVGLMMTAANQPFYPYDQTGWYPATASTASTGVLAGLTSQNNPNIKVGTKGPAAWSNLAGFYTDPDGVARRAMGGFVPSSSTSPATTPIGLPNVVASVVDPATALCAPPTANASYSPASTITINVNPGQNLGRPIVLNRPFKTVGELAYTFSDTPWKNLDLSTPESGNTALLDVFSITEVATPNALTAGKINLNTRQIPVLKAILSGAARHDAGSSPLAAADIDTIAKALVARTTGNNTASGQGPLRNPAELVGRYIGGSGTGAVFHGFSEDIAVDAPAPLGAGGSTIQRFRETSIRALSNVGTTRIWNLMIDVVSQTGRYPQPASGPDQFLVEGEKRYWVHVAIDRLTGEIIDKQVEVISE